MRVSGSVVSCRLNEQCEVERPKLRNISAASKLVLTPRRKSDHNCHKAIEAEATHHITRPASNVLTLLGKTYGIAGAVVESYSVCDLRLWVRGAANIREQYAAIPPRC
jgi:hypothetical protein